MKNSSSLPNAETISTQSFPKSKKVFVKGKIHDINIAIREIETSDTVTPKSENGEKVKITANRKKENDNNRT